MVPGLQVLYERRITTVFVILRQSNQLLSETPSVANAPIFKCQSLRIGFLVGSCGIFLRTEPSITQHAERSLKRGLVYVDATPNPQTRQGPRPLHLDALLFPTPWKGARRERTPQRLTNLERQSNLIIAESCEGPKAMMKAAKLASIATAFFSIFVSSPSVAQVDCEQVLSQVYFAQMLAEDADQQVAGFDYFNKLADLQAAKDRELHFCFGNTQCQLEVIWEYDDNRHELEMEYSNLQIEADTKRGDYNYRLNEAAWLGCS